MSGDRGVTFVLELFDAAKDETALPVVGVESFVVAAGVQSHPLFLRGPAKGFGPGDDVFYIPLSPKGRVGDDAV